MELQHVENCAGQTFRVGGRVRHNDGWLGTVVRIREQHRGPVLLHVQPDEDATFPDYYSPRKVKRFDGSVGMFFCPLDHGLSMGNYSPELR